MTGDDSARGAKTGSSAPPSQGLDPGGLRNLAGKASVGALWAILGNGGGQVIRLSSNLILTRLLFAEYFGLMALVNVFLVGLQLFSDIGIGPALIQNKREDASFVNTVWTMQVIRGFVLATIAVLAATPYAQFYEQPILTPLIQVTALTALIRGFVSPSIFTQRRHLNLKRPVILRLGAQLAGAVVMVIWAWVTRSIWSLVMGGIVTSLVTMLLSHLWLPGVPSRFRFERRAARSLLFFGSWILFSTVATFAANHLDRIIFGKLTTMTTLGVYSIAAMLAIAPTHALSALTRGVLFPLYSRIRYSSTELSEVFHTARWPLLVLGGWVTAGFVAGGPTIVRLLYDPRYWEAGWMLQILSSGLWFGVVLGSTAGTVVLAEGRSNWIAAMAVAKVVGMLVFIPIGYHIGGFPGAIVGLSISELVRYVASEFGAIRAGYDGRRQDLIFTVRVGVSALGGWLAVAYLSEREVTHVVIHAIVVFVVVTAFWSGPLLVLLRRVRRKEPLFLDDIQLSRRQA